MSCACWMILFSCSVVMLYSRFFAIHSVHGQILQSQRVHLLADFVLLVAILAVKELLVVLIRLKQLLLLLLQLPDLALNLLALCLLFYRQFHLVSGLALTYFLQSAVKVCPLCFVFA